MHRSGTSAVAGMLGALGLGLPRADDRMEWPESNPEHFESLSLALCNEAILTELGGTWDAPPELGDGTDRDGPDVEDLGAAFSYAFPEDRAAVWKDPRLCLLLPQWRTALTGPLAAVYVWRSPMAVARSLARRDAMAIPHGIALWERYNRAAIDALCGVDTYVVDYAEAMADPPAFVASIDRWLATVPALADARDGRDLDTAVATIAPDLLHQRDDDAGEPGREETGRPSVEQHELATLLAGAGGSHQPFERRPPGAETESTRTILDVVRPGARARDSLRHEIDSLRRQVAELVNSLDNTKETLAYVRRGLEYTERERDALVSSLSEATELVEGLYGSTSWRVTRPLRTSLGALDKLNRRRGGP